MAEMTADEPLTPKHGGYRHLKSFQVSQLICDVTVRFCSRYINKRSRTHDQIVQAARPGVQNIAEGSQASATSRKTELKLANVAPASLEELRLDCEDFLRQPGLPLLPGDHPALLRFKAQHCATLDAVRRWVEDEHGRAQTGTDRGGQLQAPVPDADQPPTVYPGPCSPIPSSALAANAALSLLNLACHLLDRQFAAQAKAFENEGGFTERLYRVRSQKRTKAASQ